MRATAYFATIALPAGLIEYTVAAAPLIIAILEEGPGGDWGSALQDDVRVGFIKEGIEWIALCCKNLDDAASSPW
jgi:hypothetical protein